MLYQAGSGVPRDLAEAYKWFSIAAQSGDGAARESAHGAGAQALHHPARRRRPRGPLVPRRRLQPDGDAQPGPVARQRPEGPRPPRLLQGRQTGAGSREFSLAVSAYQRDQGLPVTGALDATTAARLSVFAR